jgi:hypothetical protein
LHQGHNTNFIGIEAVHVLKRVAAWQTLSALDRGYCNRPHKRTETEDSLPRLNISESKSFMSLVRERSLSMAGTMNEKVFDEQRRNINCPCGLFDNNAHRSSAANFGGIEKHQPGQPAAARE